MESRLWAGANCLARFSARPRRLLGDLLLIRTTPAANCEDIKKSPRRVSPCHNRCLVIDPRILPVSSFTNRTEILRSNLIPIHGENACSYRAWERVGRGARGRIHGLVVSPTLPRRFFSLVAVARGGRPARTSPRNASPLVGSRRRRFMGPGDVVAFNERDC